MQGDQCLDAPCFHTKVNAHLDREVAAHPEYVQIETGYRVPKEQRPGAVQRGRFREIENTTANHDAESVPPCAAARTALIVFGKRVGTTLTVCTDDHCPIHDPRVAAAREAAHPAPVMPEPEPTETKGEAEIREQENQRQRKEYEAEQEHRAGEFRLEREREEAEYEAKQAQREEQRKARAAMFERILDNAPETFTAAQLRVLLRAIVNLDPYTFVDYLVEDMAEDNERRSAEEVLLADLDNTADNQLTHFALRLALSGHVGIPRENEFDFLTEAAALFPQTKPKQTSGRKPTLVTGSKTKPAAKKKVAA